MNARALVLLLALAALCACHGRPPASASQAPRSAASHASAESVGRARMDEAFAMLQPLVAARGVSGHEDEVREVVRERLRRINPDWQPTTDDGGNLVLVLGRGERTLLFIAHMDEIGLEVTAIRDDGILETARRGGMIDSLFQGTAVELVTARGVLTGITLPPEPASAPAPAGGSAAGSSSSAGAAGASGAQAAPPAPILVDVGAHSATEATGLGVAVGDAATVPKELLSLGRHRAAGRSNDDRVGCAALLLALGRMDARKLDRRVVFVWSTREEVGLLGADAAARSVRPVPETVFAVDTFVTSDSPREDGRYAFAPLGAGPVLRALDNTSATPDAVLDRVRAIAADASPPIALQTGTMAGGNDGSRFVPEGSINCPLAWPQRASHSRVETFDLRDLSRLADLVAAVAQHY